MADHAPTVKAFAIDRELCAGHGRCYAVAPESFTYDDLGYGVAQGQPEHRSESELQSIASECPEEAVLVVNAETRESR